MIGGIIGWSDDGFSIRFNVDHKVRSPYRMLNRQGNQAADHLISRLVGSHGHTRLTGNLTGTRDLTFSSSG
jgi:hypothetical protein